MTNVTNDELADTLENCTEELDPTRHMTLLTAAVVRLLRRSRR